MTTARVDAARQKWGTASLSRAIRELIWDTPAGTDISVTLTASTRPDTSTGEWWILEWTDAQGQHHTQASQSVDVLVRRVADDVDKTDRQLP